MGPPAEGPMWINFKNEWNIGGTGWTSYRKEVSEAALSNTADPKLDTAEANIANTLYIQRGGARS